MAPARVVVVIAREELLPLDALDAPEPLDPVELLPRLEPLGPLDSPPDDECLLDPELPEDVV
jgi:hypothetical protein